MDHWDPAQSAIDQWLRNEDAFPPMIETLPILPEYGQYMDNEFNRAPSDNVLSDLAAWQQSDTTIQQVGKDSLVPSKRSASPVALPKHPGTKRFRCNPCNRGYTTNRALRRHLSEDKMHCAEAGMPPCAFPCPHCPKVFTRAAAINRHVKKQHGGLSAQSAMEELDGAPVTKLGDSPWVGEEPPMAHRTNGSASCGKPSTADAALIGQISSGDVAAKTLGNLGMLQAEEQLVDAEVWFSKHSATDKPKLDKLLAEIPQLLRKKEVRSTTVQTMPCGICHRDFEFFSKHSLMQHLKLHLTDLSTRPHVCESCHIAFVDRKDLVRHLQSAKRGHCGFNFVHRTPCTGHHPPAEDEAYAQVLAEWCTDEISGAMERADLKDFARHAWIWELMQRQSYSRSTGALLPKGLPSECCFSAPERGARDQQSVVTFTHSEGAKLAHRPGKRITGLTREDIDTRSCTRTEAAGGTYDPLRRAILANNHNWIAETFARGMDIDVQDDNEKALLQLAVEARAYESAWALVFLGANMCVILHKDDTCLDNTDPYFCPQIETCAIRLLYELIKDRAETGDIDFQSASQWPTASTFALSTVKKMLMHACWAGDQQCFWKLAGVDKSPEGHLTRADWGFTNRGIEYHWSEVRQLEIRCHKHDLQSIVRDARNVMDVEEARDFYFRLCMRELTERVEDSAEMERPQER